MPYREDSVRNDVCFAPQRWLSSDGKSGAEAPHPKLATGAVFADGFVD